MVNVRIGAAAGADGRPAAVAAAAAGAVAGTAGRPASGGAAAVVGRAVQIDAMTPELKTPGTNLSTLKLNEPLSTFAVKFNLRRYTLGRRLGRLRRSVRSDRGCLRRCWGRWPRRVPRTAGGRGLHSSTFSST